MEQPLKALDVEVRLLPLKALARKFDDLFPGTKFVESGPWIIIASYHTRENQAGISSKQIEERNAVYGEFVRQAQVLVEHAKESNAAFADFIDPSTGAPFYSMSSTTFGDFDERYRIFGFEIMEFGCCRVISHKEFKTNVIVCAAFVSAPKEVVEVCGAFLQRN